GWIDHRVRDRFDLRYVALDQAPYGVDLVHLQPDDRDIAGSDQLEDEPVQKWLARLAIVRVAVQRDRVARSPRSEHERSCAERGMVEVARFDCGVAAERVLGQNPAEMIFEPRVQRA